MVDGIHIHVFSHECNGMLKDDPSAVSEVLLRFKVSGLMHRTFYKDNVIYIPYFLE